MGVLLAVCVLAVAAGVFIRVSADVREQKKVDAELETVLDGVPLPVKRWEANQPSSPGLLCRGPAVGMSGSCPMRDREYVLPSGARNRAREVAAVAAGMGLVDTRSYDDGETVSIRGKWHADPRVAVTVASWPGSRATVLVSAGWPLS